MLTWKKTFTQFQDKNAYFFQSHNNIRNVKYVKKLICEFNQKENKGKRFFFSEEWIILWNNQQELSSIFRYFLWYDY